MAGVFVLIVSIVLGTLTGVKTGNVGTGVLVWLFLLAIGSASTSVASRPVSALLGFFVGMSLFGEDDD